MSNTETIKKGQFVSFSYKVTDPEGNLLFEATSETPDTIVYGYTPGVLPGLEQALQGLKSGDKFEVTLPPEAAYGNYEDNLLIKLPYSVFSAEGTLPETVKKGASLPMMTDSGQRVYGTVTDITPEEVTMDFNHPFAGKTVTFSGTVGEVREATADEMNPRCGCSGGCSGGSGCGSDCGGCDDGCCS